MALPLFAAEKVELSVELPEEEALPEASRSMLPDDVVPFWCPPPGLRQQAAREEPWERPAQGATSRMWDQLRSIRSNWRRLEEHLSFLSRRPETACTLDEESTQDSYTSGSGGVALASDSEEQDVLAEAAAEEGTRPEYHRLWRCLHASLLQGKTLESRLRALARGSRHHRLGADDDASKDRKPEQDASRLVVALLAVTRHKAQQASSRSVDACFEQRRLQHYIEACVEFQERLLAEAEETEDRSMGHAKGEGLGRAFWQEANVSPEKAGLAERQMVPPSLEWRCAMTQHT